MMTVNLNGYELTDEEAAGMRASDRKASWEIWHPNWSRVIESQKDTYLSIVPDIHANGVKTFIPHGYSLSQAVAARASQLASIGMIIHDYDGESTQDGLRKLVRETYIMLLKAAICMPEQLVGFGGTGNEVNEPTYIKEHGYHMMSCTMLGEPDWSECVIDYSAYAVDEDDPYGFFHHISEDMFELEQIRIRIEQYMRWSDEDDESERITENVGEFDELYECTLLGISRRNELKTERKLSDEAYRDVHRAAAKSIMYSMAECEKALGSDARTKVGGRDMCAGELKALLDRVHGHLSWFFDYYHEERARGGVLS